MFAFVTMWKRRVQLAAIASIVVAVFGWVAVGLAHEGVEAAAYRAVVAVVIIPCALLFVLGPPLFGAVVSMLRPEHPPPPAGYCPMCEYDLRGNADPSRCPECGGPIPGELQVHAPPPG
jgi:hypothetical protein